MDLLADTNEGRWMIAPRKGARFVGSTERARARARDRRRRVLVGLLEAILLTALMGAFPPLRKMLYATGALVGLLAGYVWLLVRLKHNDRRLVAMRRTFERATVAAVPVPANGNGNGHLRERYVGGVKSRLARATYNGLRMVNEDDTVHVVVRSARELQAARA